MLRPLRELDQQPRLLIGICLLFVLLGHGLSLDEDEPPTRMPLTSVESRLIGSKTARLRDVLNRQLIHVLFDEAFDELTIDFDSEVVPPHLFATVTPCLTPVPIDIAINVKPGSANLLLSNMELSQYNREKLTLSHRVSYQLDTSNATELVISLKRDLYRIIPEAHSILLIKLSTSYPAVELGSEKYNLFVCRDNIGLNVMRVHLNPVLSINYEQRKEYLICIVVNSVRPLNEYCGAQIGLGPNGGLPYLRDRLFEGVNPSLSLPDGTFAYSCVNYSNLETRNPQVDISRVLLTKPDKIYVNAYIVRLGEDGQADATAWESLVYYFKDPQTGRSQPMLPCDKLLLGESEVALDRFGRTPGSRVAEFAVQLPPNASLLVRPTRQDLLAPLVHVELTPYSSQSLSMLKLMSKMNCSSGDDVWAYGGVICGPAGRHTCLPDDSKACQFDFFRVRLTSQTRLRTATEAHSYANVTELAHLHLSAMPRFKLHFVRSAADHIVPAIGRVTDALKYQRHVIDEARFLVSKEISLGHNLPPERNERLQKANKTFEQVKSALEDCEITLTYRPFEDTANNLLSKSIKCLSQLWQSHITVVKKQNQASASGDALTLFNLYATSATPISFNVIVESTATSSLAAIDSPDMNRYHCEAYRVELRTRFATDLTGWVVELAYRPKNKDHRRAIARQMYRAVHRLIEARLLATLPITERPSDANQGFVRNRREIYQATEIRKQNWARSDPRRKSQISGRRLQMSDFKAWLSRKKLELHGIISHLVTLVHSSQQSVSPEPESHHWDPSHVSEFSFDLKHSTTYYAELHFVAVYMYAVPVGQLNQPSVYRRDPSLFGFKLDGYVFDPNSHFKRMRQEDGEFYHH